MFMYSMRSELQSVWRLRGDKYICPIHVRYLSLDSTDGYLDWVMLDPEGMKPRDAAAAEEIRMLRGYLKENQGRVKYRALRRKGYPIGSSGIESANKFSATCG
jgi:hypothetical protein